MLPFEPVTPPEPKQEGVDTNQEIPKDFDIFYKSESEFLPKGKTYSDLTPEEMRILRSQYRFSPLRPGMYQTLSGFKNSM